MPLQDSILLIEDNEDDVYFMKRALANAGITAPLRVIEDGQSAVDFLTRVSGQDCESMPKLVLLDLKLPLVPGLDVLKRIRSYRELDPVYVVILVSFTDENETQTASSLGASDFLAKPPTGSALVDLCKRLHLDWVGR